MSPIFVRPVREQLEHDRLIRFLQAKYKRKFDVAINVGDEQVAPVKVGTATFFPDLVLTAGKKLAGVVEVESGESVNNLEAMAQWVHFSQARVPFHLYVPVQVYDAARRLCEANKVSVAELWTYRPTADGFDLVRMIHDASASPAPVEPAGACEPSRPRRRPHREAGRRRAAKPRGEARSRRRNPRSRPRKRRRRVPPGAWRRSRPKRVGARGSFSLPFIRVTRDKRGYESTLVMHAYRAHERRRSAAACCTCFDRRRTCTSAAARSTRK